jgi:hypothetical protein
MTIEVMKQAMEALEQITSPLHVSEAIRIGTAQAALRQAISRPDCKGCRHYGVDHCRSTVQCVNGDMFSAPIAVKLYKVTP